jgi:large subunit ribosomal protein L16
MQKGQFAGLSKGANFVHFGEYGIQVLERGWITNQQIEACRVAINRFFQRRGKVWIRVFLDKPITKKPAEVRMGKGKGAPEYWVAVVRPGRMIFEAEGVPLEVAREALRLAAQKLPVQTKFVMRRDYVEA